MTEKNSALAEIGKITRLHGFKGEMTVLVTIAASSELHTPKKVFLDNGIDLEGYDVLEFAMKTGTMAKLKLKGVDTEADAKKLVGSFVMVEPEVLPAAEVLRAQIRSLVGFEVIDSELGNIGKMTGLLDIPTNPIIQVLWNNKEVLIPLNENIVTGIDQKQKQILVTTPPGLLDL